MCRFAPLSGLLFATALVSSSRLSAQVDVTVTSNVSGQPFTVSGSNCSTGNYTVPQKLRWTPGASCSIAFSSPYNAQFGTRYVFGAWQDMDTSNPRTFVAPDQASTLTATFTTQYDLVVQTSPQNGGTATGDGWYASGAQATISATASSGYQFSKWSIGGIGGQTITTNPAVITVDYPRTAVANFKPITIPAPNRYTVIPLIDQSSIYGANAMNDYGQVLGCLNNGASLWTPSTPNGILGAMQTLTAPCSGLSINSVGEIAAGTQGGLTLFLPARPNAATLTQNDVPLGYVQVSSLNAFGQVGGRFNGKPGIWTPNSANGTAGTLTLNDQFDGLIAMNGFGQAIMSAGSTQSQAVLFTPSSPNSAAGTFTPISGPDGASRTTLVAISDDGTVLGSSCSTTACTSFLWKPDSPNSTTGRTTAFPGPAGALIYGTAMSPRGDVVGTISAGQNEFFPFLYSGGVIYDLSVALPVGSTPHAINSSGQIAAYGGQNYYGIVVATPQPASETPPPNAVSVTVGSSVSGQPFTVAGTGCSAGAYTGTQTLLWTPGASCVVTFGSPYSTQLSRRYVFDGWSDGVRSNPRTFVAPAQAANYTANFVTQYLVTGEAVTPGTGTVSGGGWYAVNSNVTMTAQPAPGYVFVQWISVAPGTTGPLNFTVSSYPVDAIAYFAVAPAPASYTVTYITNDSDQTCLNDYGQVAGRNEGSALSPYLWTPLTPNGTLGNLTIVSLPPFLGLWEGYSQGGWNDVFGLNSRGQILGANTLTGEEFLWTPTSPNSPDGTPVAISSPSSAPFVTPFLSNYGEVAANLNGSWGIWTPNLANGTTGTITSNPGFAGAAGINSNGQIIINQPQSDGSTLPILFTPSNPHSVAGTFTMLPGLSGYTRTKLVAINDNGTIIGYSYTDASAANASTSQGFIWTPIVPNGTFGTLGAIPLSAGVAATQPTALNNEGDVVGSMTFPSSGGGTPPSVPFLFSKGALYDLSHISGVPQYSQAIAINEAGQILFGRYQIFLATPTVPVTPATNPIPVVITSNPVGQVFAVTGTGCSAGNYLTPQTFQWPRGASCVVKFISPYSSFAETRTVFTGWQDGNSSNPRTLTTQTEATITPVVTTTYTANFRTEYYLTVQANVADVGTVDGSGWYTANGSAILNAPDAAGYKFVNWYADYQTQSNPLVLKMDRSKIVIANYVPAANVAPGSYSITTVVGGGRAAGMNEYGQVAGTVAGVPFLWTPTASNGALGGLVNLADTAQSIVPVSGVAINDIGQVVTLAAANTRGRILLWSPDSPNAGTGTLTELPLSSPGGAVPFNNYGQIGGSINNQGSIWTPDAPNGTTGSLNANPQWNYLTLLNGFGQGVIGFFPVEAPQLFTPFTANGTTGTYTRLPVIVSTRVGAIAYAAAISEDGAIVGRTDCAVSFDCLNEGFLWKPDAPHGTSGSVTLFPPLPGFSQVSPAAMNSKGDVVGVMDGVPFLYTGGVVYALTALSDFASNASPVAINSAGEILFNAPSGAYLAMLTSRPGPPSNPAPVTISANVDAAFSITGDGCSAGVYRQMQTLKWTPGATCTVAFLSPDTVLDSRFVFTSWQDGNTSNPRTFTAPSEAATYSANFKTQFYVGTLIQPAGSGTVAGAGWYDQQSIAVLTATPASGFTFLKWTSASGSSSENPLTVTVGSAQTFTAMFNTMTTPVPGDYTITLIAHGGTGIAINDFGQVTGSFSGSTGYGAFLWTPVNANGVLGSLNTIPEMDSAGGLNAMGQVAGTSSVTYEELLWTPDVPNGTVGTVSSIASPFYGRVTALNDSGQIGATWGTGSSIWTPDHANGPTGSLSSDARFFGLVAMNAYGQAIMNGGSTSKTNPTWIPLLFTPSTVNSGNGTFTPVTGPVGMTQVTLTAIAADGTVLAYGCAKVAGGCLNQAFFWTPAAANASTGSPLQIPMPTNIVAMTPAAMNANRDFIGSAQEASGLVLPFLYVQGILYDLTSLINVPPVAINSAGQILFNAMGNVYIASPMHP